jgi:type III secretion protein S
MNQSEIVNILSNALNLTLLLSMPAIAVAAIVGTLFSLLQALTQIQEQTLSFAIKLIAVALTLYLTAGWMGGQLFNYALAIFDGFPRMVR